MSRVDHCNQSREIVAEKEESSGAPKAGARSRTEASSEGGGAACFGPRAEAAASLRAGQARF
jgi:hypothetical protein